jgi:UDP-N-acetylglucosamine 3-dehydrogenase
MEHQTHLAIIGYGHMGQIYKSACEQLCHYKNYENYYKYDLPQFLDNLKLVAIVDPLLKTSKQDGIHFFNSLDEMLNATSIHINAAVIASPIKTHQPIAKELIEKNIDLLIEKPVCKTAAEIKGLIDLAETNNVKLMPGHVERYNPVTLEAKEVVNFKPHGSAQSYNFTRTSEKPQRVKDDLVIDKLIHDLDLIQGIFGNFDISDIQVKKKGQEVQECLVSTQHKDGLQGKILSSWLIAKKERTLHIDFEKAVFKGDFIEKNIHLERRKEFPKEIIGYQNNQIKDLVADFIAFIHQPIPTMVKMEDAYQSAIAIDLINRRILNEI